MENHVEKQMGTEMESGSKEIMLDHCWAFV